MTESQAWLKLYGICRRAKIAPDIKSKDPLAFYYKSKIGSYFKYWFGLCHLLPFLPRDIASILQYKLYIEVDKNEPSVYAWPNTEEGLKQRMRYCRRMAREAKKRE